MRKTCHPSGARNPSGEKIKNKNTEAIVKVYSEIASNLMDDMDDQFGDELYIDGTLAANSFTEMRRTSP